MERNSSIKKAAAMCVSVMLSLCIFAGSSVVSPIKTHADNKKSATTNVYDKKLSQRAQGETLRYSAGIFVLYSRGRIPSLCHGLDQNACTAAYAGEKDKMGENQTGKDQLRL